MLRKRWVMVAIQIAVVVVVVWFVRRTLYEAMAGLRQHDWHLDPAWMAAAGALGMLGFLPAGLFWHRLLRVMGQDARMGETLRAYYIGQLGKYVPGKVMVVVIRAGLIRSHRVDTGVAAASVFFETLTMMSVGGFLAGAIQASLFRDQRMSLLVGVALMLLFGLPTLPPVFRRLARLAGVGRSDPATAEKLKRVGFGTLLLGWVAMTAAWTTTGLSLWAVLRAMGLSGLDPVAELPFYTGGVAFAKVAGFISHIPAGLGVADVTLTEILRTHFADASVPGGAQAAALLAAVGLRMSWVVAELLISIILYLGGLRRARSDAEGAYAVDRADCPPASQDLTAAEPAATSAE
jgi:glycosyltransferase 2 family protein